MTGLAGSSHRETGLERADITCRWLCKWWIVKAPRSPNPRHRFWCNLCQPISPDKPKVRLFPLESWQFYGPRTLWPPPGRRKPPPARLNFQPRPREANESRMNVTEKGSGRGGWASYSAMRSTWFCKHCIVITELILKPRVQAQIKSTLGDEYGKFSSP